MMAMPSRPALPDQRHIQLRNEFLSLVAKRKDMDPASAEYQTKSTEIDQVLASVWRLGTIYSRTPGVYDR